MKLRLLAALVVGTTLTGSVAVTSGATSSQTPYAQMQKVIADANHESSVRVTTTATMSGMRIVQITDAGRTSGRQSITLTQNGKSNTILAELVAGALYVKGNATILTTYLALSQEYANELAGQWFGIPKGSGYYAQISEGLTISTGLAEVMMTAPVTDGPATTFTGVKVDVLKGKSVKSAVAPSFAESMYYSITKRPLPVEVTQSVQGSIGKILFSHWNENIVIVAPTVKLHLN